MYAQIFDNKQKNDKEKDDGDARVIFTNNKVVSTIIITSPIMFTLTQTTNFYMFLICKRTISSLCIMLTGIVNHASSHSVYRIAYHM